MLTACNTPGTATNPGGTGSLPTMSTRHGTPVTTARFSTVVPDTWTNKIGDQTEVAKFNGTGVVLLLVEQGPPGVSQPNVNDVQANINVVVLAQPVPDDQQAAYLPLVSSTGATNLSSVQPFTVDGASGQFITYDRDLQGTPAKSRDMLVNHGGSSYHIVLNTSRFAFEQQQLGLVAVLTAWRWTT
jgi:hypothetical protein